MAVVSAELPRSAVRALKRALFIVIGLMLAYVLYHNEHFLVDPADTNWPHYRDIGRWLLPHGLIGAVALAAGLLQFSSRLRSAFPKVHRIGGRIYITAVFVAAPLGAYITYLDQQIGYTWSFTMAGLLFAGLWMLATAMAFGLILKRRVDLHRQWMTRSFSMLLIFLEVRVFEGMTGWGEDPAGDTIAVWAFVVLGYPLADLALLLEDLLQGRAAKVTAKRALDAKTPGLAGPSSA